MFDYHQLNVWERAHQLALDVYHLTAHFPRHERYQLTSQLRRAATSVPTNIAEGSGRGRAGECAQFLRVAAGSVTELSYLLELAQDLGYAKADVLIEETSQIRRMLTSLERRVTAEQWPTGPPLPI